MKGITREDHPNAFRIAEKVWKTEGQNVAIPETFPAGEWEPERLEELAARAGEISLAAVNAHGETTVGLSFEDAEEFLALAAEIPIRTLTTDYPLAAANQALADLKAGRVAGAAVLVP